ncbi:MAG: sulfatase-like hydrolase/transferase [Pirellulales bacterium]|nr:sulfatase-like hydrolase/transferase [Pirellulales bacterium]
MCSLSWADSCTGSADNGSPPNILVILCDDLGYGDPACFGNKTIKTPNIDKLASEGMRLTDCYASAPVCSPSRAGMLTGRTPNRLGVYDWIPEGSPMHMQRSEVTIATLLKQAGYDTCHVGKWHCNGKFNSPEQPQPLDHGFAHWFSTQNNAIPSHFNPVNFVRNGEKVGLSHGYSSKIVADEAINWLKNIRDRSRPFCLFVWYHEPHEPIAAPEKYTKLYPQAKKRGEALYYGNVTQMDSQVGRLMKVLDKQKLRDNTMVIFTSDNGPETLSRYKSAWRSHGTPGDLRGMKLWMYEGGIRVPGIIRWPGHTRPGQVCSEPICGLDVLPTLCDIVGIRQPADRAIDGSSILPIFEGKPVKRKTPLYWQYDRALGWAKVAMRDGDWKLLADADLKKFELYNIKKDISEKNDLAQKEPQRLNKMKADLTHLHTQVKAEGPTWPERKQGRKK